jgi:murein DD-endopeptidase MepM/ murein hydrolase activator NlpD
MRALKRIGWGAAALLLLLVAAFLSMVKITVQPASQAQERRAVAPAAAGGAAPANAPDTAPIVIPVAGVSAGQLSDTWGDSRGGGQRVHNAIDIMAPMGTPVLAAASGTVEKIFESAAGGHTIYVRTLDGGTVHYYAHLSSYLVSEGQRVQQGQTIATVGNTGSAAGGAPHLHFEVKAMQPGEKWWQGTNLNPYPLLTAPRR